VSADGPEEREAERQDAADLEWARIEQDEQRADELRDALIDIMTPVQL
jgi:hypothetical protein